jgi:hypothetical protein
MARDLILRVLALVVVPATMCAGQTVAAPRRAPAIGPLAVHPQNGRYFATPDGRAILLTGSHTWETVQDAVAPGDPRRFDFDAFLGLAEANGHNFIRLWPWEHPLGAGWSRTPVTFHPLPWARPGPGLASDGKPRFDPDRLDDDYFARLRERVLRARDRGFYVSVMLFQGWSLKKTGGQGMDPFVSHPFNGPNNVNGVAVVHGTEDSDEKPTLHGFGNAAALRYREAYVRRVIELDLRGARGPFAVEWWHPLERRMVPDKGTLVGDDYVVLTPPFPGPAVLFLERR